MFRQKKLPINEHTRLFWYTVGYVKHDVLFAVWVIGDPITKIESRHASSIRLASRISLITRHTFDPNFMPNKGHTVRPIINPDAILTL